MATDDTPTWMVRAKVDPILNDGSVFEDDGPSGLTEVEAEREAQRRNVEERRAGFKGIDWFPHRDRVEAMKQAGYDVSRMRGRK